MIQILLIVQLVYLDGAIKRSGIEYETMDSCLTSQAKFLHDMEGVFDTLGANSLAAACSIRRKASPT